MNRIGVTMVALLVLASCRGDEGLRDDQATGSIDSAAWRAARELPQDVLAALDSGNAAFRAKDYNAARDQYRRAIELAPEESAGWFGLSMVERQLGNVAAADSAMQRVTELTPQSSLVAPATDSNSIHP